MKRTLLILVMLIFILTFTLSSCDSLKKDELPDDSDVLEDEADDDDLEENADADGKDTSKVVSTCNHEFGEWRVTKESDCKYSGRKMSTCLKCGKSQSSSLPTHHTEVIKNSVAPTCKTSGLTEGRYCSVCGLEFVRQENVEKLPHSYLDGICQECGSPEPSQGLEFIEVSSGYALSGSGTCKDDVIVVPDTYNGRPVVEIAQNAFSYDALDDAAPREIVIPDSVTAVRYSAIEFYKFFKIFVHGNTKFEEQSISARGGFEIIKNSTDEIPENAYGSGDECTPYIIHSGPNSKCETTQDGFVFIQNGINMFLCDYVGTAEQIVLPAHHNNLRYVVSNYCFAGNDTIKSVKLGGGVLKIGETCFLATPLESVDLSGMITDLPFGCFYGCKNLKNIEIPDNIISIQAQAFYESGIETATIGKNVKTISVFAFWRSPNLDTLYFNATNCEQVGGNGLDGFEKVLIGANVESIPAKFMQQNESLTSVIFAGESSCKSIGSAAFRKTSITEIVLPKSITQLFGAFGECKNLEKIKICCEAIQSSYTVFSDCGENGSGIVITVSPDVRSLPSNFIRNSKIKSLIFESGCRCETIGSNFSATKISNVELPATLKGFDKSSFDLKTLSINSQNQYLKFQDSCLVSRWESKLIAVLDKDYKIPDYITKIEKNAFMESGATRIYIPDTVLLMEEGSLNCETVESVSLPFIGLDRDTSIQLYKLFSDEKIDLWLEIKLGMATGPAEYFIPPNLNKLTIRGTKLCSGALDRMTMIRDIEISDSVTEISEGVFGAYWEFARFSRFYFSGTQEQWDKLKESGWLHDLDPVNVTFNAQIDK